MICLKPDEFLNDKTYWFCKLSNGETVYQDDNRPGLEESRAWIRLGQYVKSNNLKIESMSIRFRSHVEDLPSHCAAYYFSYGVIQDLTSPQSLGTYVLGFQQTPDDDIVCMSFVYPELLVISGSKKSKNKVQEPFIIRNY